MLQELRPLNVFEIFGQAIRLYYHHFVLLISIVALVLAPMTVLAVLGEIVWQATGIFNLVQNAVLWLVQGGLVLAIAGAYLNQPLSIWEVYQLSLRRYLSLWGAFLMAGLAIGTPVMLLALILGVVIGPEEAPVLVILGLLAVPYFVYFFIRWRMILPGIMLEDLGATDGLQWSWNLTGEMFWHVAGVQLLLYLLMFFIVNLPVTAMTLGMIFLLPDQAITSVIAVLATQLGNMLIMPLAVAVIVVLYYDLRVRKGGHVLRTSFGMMDDLGKEGFAFEPVIGPRVDPRVGPQVHF